MPTVARKTKTVARKTVARKTTAKAKPVSAKAPKTKAAPKAPPVARGQTQAQIVAKAVPAIVKALKAGTTMTDIRSQYGAGSVIRKALAEAGYNTKGEKVAIEAINGSGAVLAKRVAAARGNGAAWWSIELATGKTESALRTLLSDHGFSDLTEGRVIREQEARVEVAQPAATKTVAKKTTAKAKPAAKPAAKAKAKPTAKATAKAEVKPGRRVRRVNPSNAA